MFGTYSRKLKETPCLTQLLGAPVLHLRNQAEATTKKVQGIVGWGYRPTTTKPRKIANRLGLPYVAVEDGFLRSYGTGSTHPSLSLVVDTSGIYYAATGPSDLENLLRSPLDLLNGPGADYEQARSLIIRLQLSKYNAAPELREHIGGDGGPRILVVDQTNADASVEHGMADKSTFVAMLREARSDYPNGTIYIKTHPEVSRGDKKGYLQKIDLDPRTVLLKEEMNAISLLEQMDHVYVVTSQLGFEALLLNKKVSCFGLPWYAGWGVTHDKEKCPRRDRTRSVDELFAAAYLHYTRYINPETHDVGSIFDVIRWLSRQRESQQLLEGRTFAIGFRRWKAENIRPFLGLERKKTHFVKDATAASRFKLTPNDRIVIWGAQPSEQVRDLASISGAKITKVEDGFFRSVGLGSDFVPPQSIVLDDLGLYFDTRQPSQLENILSTTLFSEEDLIRAQAIINLITEKSLTKYNIEPNIDPIWNNSSRHTILVTGQVEDDASILYGASDIRDNLSLLIETRRCNPGSFIVYKPHPDVTVKNRKGRLASLDCLNYADVIENNISVVSCIAASDEVHTITSLSGFEALIRNKKVKTYGMPFYAGWGLTEDNSSQLSRSRKLSIYELVAGVLIHYPTYWDWTLNGYTTCEASLNQLVRQRESRLSEIGVSGIQKTHFQRQLHKIRIWAKAGFSILG
ncbi:capsular polysaccharide biosynthesis protein [Alcaligenaceae bacterium B3P038]|nr:capsular polysaccharide biosynthesis protein [Alcaligenaceae bacterium B3P038]